MPASGVDVFDGFEFQALRIHRPFEVGKLLVGPELIGVAGAAPAFVSSGGLVAGRIIAAVFEVVDEVRHEVRCPALAGEAEVVRIEHVTIKAESELHGAALNTGEAEPRVKIWPGSLRAGKKIACHVRGPSQGLCASRNANVEKEC